MTQQENKNKSLRIFWNHPLGPGSLQCNVVDPLDPPEKDTVVFAVRASASKIHLSSDFVGCVWRRQRHFVCETPFSSLTHTQPSQIRRERKHKHCVKQIRCDPKIQTRTILSIPHDKEIGGPKQDSTRLDQWLWLRDPLLYTMAASVMNYHGGSSLRLTGGITKSRTKTISRLEVANPKKLKNARKMLFGPVDRDETRR